MSDIALGTVYDVNKQGYKTEPVLTEGVLNSKKEIIKNYLRKTQNTYYMLLRKEISDYTIFRIDPSNEDKDSQYDELIQILIDECLIPRGQIKDIDFDKNKVMLEMWLYNEEDKEDDTKNFMYGFFPCDFMMVEV